MIPYPGSPLTLQFARFNYGTGFFLEFAHSVAQGYSNLEQESQGRICMHPELSKSMPVSQVEKKLENDCVVGFRQKAIKNWYGALDEHWDVSKIQILIFWPAIDSTYLQQILIIACRHLFELRTVRRYPPHTINPERGNLSEAN